MNFCLTIDVEPDAHKDWSRRKPLSFDGVYEGLTKLKNLCKEFGIKPTYFVDPFVLNNKGCVYFLKTLEGELATHYHGESEKEMLTDSPPDIRFNKLKDLTDLFIDKIGYKPLSFRSGRFAADGQIIRCLEKLGYTHDSSVTPYKMWENKIDYTKAILLQPYQVNPNNILGMGMSKITEVPISITQNRLWLRPTFSSLRMMKRVVRWYERMFYFHSPTLCMMFHNVELVPKRSPYFDTEAQCQKVIDDLRRLFEYLNCDYKTIKEI